MLFGSPACEVNSPTGILQMFAVKESISFSRKCEIVSKPQLKYPGVILDSRLKFKGLEYTADKANKNLNAFWQIKTACISAGLKHMPDK